MEKWKKRAINLLTSIVFGGQEKNTVVPYYPQKNKVNGHEAPSLPRSIPESHGISSKRLYSMLSDLEAERRSNIHNLMVIKDGEVILECSADGYGVNHWHLSHSMTKSVIGMAVGLLFDDGLVTLGTRLIDIFPDIPYRDKRFASITLDHLLTMTTGVQFNEAGSVTESEWSSAFFASMLNFAPGTQFQYNSMNSYILSRIVCHLSGRSVGDYAEERIFAPLGITNFYWEIGPEGVEKGGWGLYLSCESWAKLGIMFMNGGAYEGNRILSEKWVGLMAKTHAITPEFNGDFNYGYQMWVARESGQLLFNGMLGQDVWMCPENRIIVSMQSGNNELFQEGSSLNIIKRYLGGAIDDPISLLDYEMLRNKERSFMRSRAWVHPLEKHHGLFCFLGLKNRTPYDERWDSLLGSYKFPENNSGILPLFVRAMQNNLESSIDLMTFERHGDELFLVVRERGVEHRIEVGLYEYKSTVLDFRGEKYIVSAIGEAEHNPDGLLAYRVEIIYPELPNTLKLRFRKTLGDRVAVNIREMPNSGVIDTLASRIVNSNTFAEMLMDVLDARFGEDLIRERIESTFAPNFVAADTSATDYEKIVADEEAIARQDSHIVKMIKGVVQRYIRYEEAEDGPIDKKIKSFFRGAWDLLKKK